VSPWTASGLQCISTASLWHGFHFYRYKAGVVASQLGLLAATGSVQCQRHQLRWIEEIIGYPMMYGTSGFETMIGRETVVKFGHFLSKPLSLGFDTLKKATGPFGFNHA